MASKYKYASGSINVETVLHFLNDRPMTSRQVTEILKLNSVEINVSSRLGYLKKTGWAELGEDSLWSITKQGQIKLAASPEKIQLGSIALLPMRHYDKGPRKPISAPEPEPTFSIAAQNVMSAIAPILDLDQSLITDIQNALLALQKPYLETAIKIPKVEKGLMESISLTHIANAKRTNALIEIKAQLKNLMEIGNDSSEKGNTK